MLLEKSTYRSTTLFFKLSVVVFSSLKDHLMVKS